MNEKPPEIRQRGPNPKIARMSREEIIKEFIRPMKFLARHRSPRISVEGQDG